MADTKKKKRGGSRVRFASSCKAGFSSWLGHGLCNTCLPLRTIRHSFFAWAGSQLLSMNKGHWKFCLGFQYKVCDIGCNHTFITAVLNRVMFKNHIPHTVVSCIRSNQGPENESKRHKTLLYVNGLYLQSCRTATRMALQKHTGKKLCTEVTLQTRQ